MRRRGAELLADRYSWDAIAGATSAVYTGHPSRLIRAAASRPPSDCARRRHEHECAQSGGRRRRLVSTCRAHAPGPPLRGPARHPGRARRAAGAGHQPALDAGTPRRPACSAACGRAGRPATPTRPRCCARRAAERLAELAADPSVVDDLGAVSRRLQTALTGTSWFESRAGSPLRTVAYFSPEFGITEALPQYSGGLGVLAGDHLKASSDLGVPLVGIGLLYTEGYFRQRLDADGWQQESVAEFDPASLGLADTGVEVTVDLAGDPVRAHVWRADVGRIPLYLLDTDVAGQLPRRRRRDRPPVRRRRAPSPAPGDRARHRRRAGAAGARHRSRRVPHQRGPRRLPRARAHPRAGRRTASPFAAAVEVVRGGGVFTTHTPVPAGIDRFPRALMAQYFTDVRRRVRRDVRRACSRSVSRRPTSTTTSSTWR